MEGCFLEPKDRCAASVCKTIMDPEVLHLVPSLCLNRFNSYFLEDWLSLCLSSRDSAGDCCQLPTHLCKRPAHADIEPISLSSNERENLTVEFELGITFSLMNYGQGTRTVKYKPWEQQVNLSGHCELKGLYCVLQRRAQTAEPPTSSSPQLGGDRYVYI